MKQKIPKKITIGNLVYTIGNLAEQNGELYGKSSHNEQWIRLNASFGSGEKKMETFWHECVHQILDISKFNDESANEKLVDCLARGIYQISKQL